MASDIPTLMMSDSTPATASTYAFMAAMDAVPRRAPTSDLERKDPVGGHQLLDHHSEGTADTS